MEDAHKNIKEGADIDGIRLEDDEMDIDAQMAMAAEPTHNRYLQLVKHEHEARLFQVI